MSLETVTGALLTWLTPSAASNSAEAERSRSLSLVVCVTMAIVTVVWIGLAIIEPEVVWRDLGIAVAVDVLGIVFLVVNRGGRTRVASWLFVLGLIAVISAVALSAGGVRAPGMMAFLVVVMMAGLLLGERGSVVVALLCTAVAFGLALLETRGELPSQIIARSPWSHWLRICMYLAVTVLAQRLATQTLARALRGADAEVRERRRAQQRLAMALQAGKIGVWEYDPASGQITADESLFELYALPHPPGGAIDVATWLSRVHPEDKERVGARLPALTANGGTASTEFRLVRPDGSTRYVDSSASAISAPDGRTISVVGMNLDATERNEAHRDRERLLRDLGERVKELRLLHGATRLLRPERKLDRSLLQELVLMLPLAWQYPECCEARVSYLDIEASTPGWGGSPWKQSATFRTDDGGGSIEVVYREERPPAHEGPFLKEERSVLDSLAEILLGYIELRRHQEGLEQLVEIRTEELSVAVEAAQAAYRAKSAFLANMSHEIRTPMNAILGFGQLMERDRDLSSKSRERLRRMLVGGEHLLELINNVLEMSKAEAGHMRVISTTFDLPEEIGHVIEMLRERIEEKGLTFSVDGVEALPRFVRGDAGKLRQILINLLANAAKFTDLGRVILRASARPDGPRVTLTFEVEDTGPGISALDVDAVFEPFGQAELGAASQGGTGLGVPISRDFARLMGGDLTLRSTVGVGSVFRLDLPLDVSSLSERRRTPRDERRVVGLQPGQRRATILIADDTVDSRIALRELLIEIGLQVLEAARGDEVVDIFFEQSPDLIFTDWKMPFVDGLAAVRQIRSRAAGAKVPIVVLSASVLESERAEVFQSGANDFLAKPYRERDIWGALERHLGLRFVREDLPPVRAPGVEPSAAGVAALGYETLRAVADALERGDVETADRILASIEGLHQDVVASLRIWLDEFAFDRVRITLERGMTDAAAVAQP